MTSFFSSYQKIQSVKDTEIAEYDGDNRRLHSGFPVPSESSHAAATTVDGSSTYCKDFGDEEHRAIFWNRKQGIYFAYKWR